MHSPRSPASPTRLPLGEEVVLKSLPGREKVVHLSSLTAQAQAQQGFVTPCGPGHGQHLGACDKLNLRPHPRPLNENLHFNVCVKVCEACCTGRCLLFIHLRQTGHLVRLELEPLPFELFPKWSGVGAKLLSAFHFLGHKGWSMDGHVAQVRPIRVNWIKPGWCSTTWAS